MHDDPLTLGNAGLIHHRAKRRGEATAEARGGLEAQLIGQADQIEVGARERDVLREGAPLREARLELVIAHLLVAGAARPAAPARTDERHGDPIADLPPGYELARGGYHAG